MSNSLRLDRSSVRQWAEITGCRYPVKVGAQCPFCGLAALFTLEHHQHNPHAGIGSAVAQCGACNKKPRFSFIHDQEPNNLNRWDKTSAGIRMYPASVRSFDMPELPAEFPEPLRRAFEDTVRIFNSQIYGACATSGRRTLEGIFKYLLPEDKRNLPLVKLIEAAESEIDFSAPMSRLSNSIRQGGNLGAHFDEDQEPDAKMARSMLELLQYLIEYLYVLPTQIAELEEILSKAPAAKAE